MIEFYEDPIPDSYAGYQSYTQGNRWDHADYAIGLPKNFAAENTKEGLKAVLQAPASKFAFGMKKDDPARVAFEAAVSDASDQKLIVLKGLHQYKDSTAHLTAAWFTTLWHFNVIVNGTGKLSVRSVTEGATSISSEATGWQTVGKG